MMALEIRAIKYLWERLLLIMHLCPLLNVATHLHWNDYMNIALVRLQRDHGQGLDKAQW